MQKLKTWDIVALGFMTFALFLGAGNIIFPPIVGQAAGTQQWMASLGFLLTGVGLPLLTVVALARVGGGMDALTRPIGRVAGTLLGVAVYLTIGPLFATPRTATVSFEMGMAPFTGNTPTALFVFSLVYFGLVMLLSLFPGKLMDTVGKLITPVLILALVVLGGAAFVAPAGSLSAPVADYATAGSALAQSFLQGYQTMDALGALVFGIVIVNAIRDTGIGDSRLHTRYAIYAGCIAAVGLCLVYVSLIFLGSHIGDWVPAGASGVEILTAYVHHTFGDVGIWLLAAVILLACLTTGVGLVSACATYFSALTKISYRAVVIVLCVFSMVVSNQGLAQLIAVAVPVLYTVYPVAIALVVLNLLSRFWRHPRGVFIPVMVVALVFGLLDGIKAAGWTALVPAWIDRLPGASMALGWLSPVLLVWVIACVFDRCRPPARS